MMLHYIITNIDFQDTFILITLVAHVILHMYFRAVSAFSRAEQLIIALKYSIQYSVEAPRTENRGTESWGLENSFAEK